MLEIPPAAPGDVDPPATTREPRAAAPTRSTFRVTSANSASADPPPRVLDALDTASGAHSELAARGLSVSFDLAPGGGLQVSLLDERGRVLRRFSPADALDALSGEHPLDGILQ